jgi:hypothetical protein
MPFFSSGYKDGIFRIEFKVCVYCESIPGLYNVINYIVYIVQMV